MPQIYAIPCNHPACEDGVFYMETEFPKDWKDTEHFLVDRKSFMQMMSEEAPHMIKHAYYKFGEDQAENRFRNGKQTFKPSMGTYVYDSYVSYRDRLTFKQHFQNRFYEFIGKGKFYVQFSEPFIDLTSGDAETMILAQELDLFCVPISVKKTKNNLHHIEALKEKLAVPEKEAKKYMVN